MKRIFYVAVGAGAGIAATQRARRAARALTPGGLAGSAGSAVSGLRGSIRVFLDDVRLGMTEREIELTEALTGEPARSNESKAPGGSKGPRSAAAARTVGKSGRSTD
jgi:hypothetical protein